MPVVQSDEMESSRDRASLKIELAQRKMTSVKIHDDTSVDCPIRSST